MTLVLRSSLIVAVPVRLGANLVQFMGRARKFLKGCYQFDTWIVAHFNSINCSAYMPYAII